MTQRIKVQCVELAGTPYRLSDTYEVAPIDGTDGSKPSIALVKVYHNGKFRGVAFPERFRRVE